MNLNDHTNILKEQAAGGFAAARSGLVQDDAKPYVLELDTWKVTGTGAALGATAGTPSGAFGLTVGAFATNSPKIAGEAASGNTKTNKMRRQYTLPPEYVAGETVTLRVRCKETVGAATVSTSIDAAVYKCDKEAGIGSDLCATALQDVTTSFGNKDFDITSAGLAAGDVLDIELTGVTTDTGGTVGTILNITNTEMLLDIKG